MSDTTKFITHNLCHIIGILELMKQPKGTSIEEICKELNINRRSVFRLLKTIEQKFNKPFIIHRASFGGKVSYHLSLSFIDKLSCISLPKLRLTFSQAVFVYLILNDDSFQSNRIKTNEIEKLRKCLETFYDQ